MTQTEETRKTIDTQMRSVQSMYKVSDMDYNNFQFDLGMEVLKSYIINEEDWKPISYDKNYWNWFRMQFQIFEKETLQFLTQRNHNDFHRYQLMMSTMMNSKRIEIAFYQFLTIFKYIR